MGVIARDGVFDAEWMAEQINALRSLLHDLERLQRGEQPDKSELEDAPLIANWRFGYRKAVCLEGTMHGHPILGSIVPGGITSELWYIDLKLGFARTYSRFYRLGKPAGPIPDDID
ncbi:DUF6634 family protein [Daeguia caeni]|uniref:DUF6634 family protein n=1 Tax=Daeguia caeni TaxID=439612 RepID=A0ABV9H8E3_9HYPH